MGTLVYDKETFSFTTNSSAIIEEGFKKEPHQKFKGSAPYSYWGLPIEPLSSQNLHEISRVGSRLDLIERILYAHVHRVVVPELVGSVQEWELVAPHSTRVLEDLSDRASTNLSKRSVHANGSLLSFDIRGAG
jgi:hypothetical protein